MIEVENLTKWYGPTRAVHGISFKVPEGQIVGFLGPNGAGKSTTLRMLTGYLPPTSGRATVAGFDVSAASEQARASIGYLPENTPLYPEMRVEEYLHYRGKLLSMPRSRRRQRIDVVCDRCGLDQVRQRVIGHLSRGNRQRVGLAQALLHEPPVLILDEPTAGLDPNQINHVRDLIAELRGKHTVILSTHILPEVERMADRVIVIAGGTIRADGAPSELRQQVTAGSSVVVQLKGSAEAVARAFRGIDGVEATETSDQAGWCRAVVRPRKDKDVREALGQAALSNGWAVREMRYEVASLEQFFIEITAKQHEESATPAA